MQMSEIMSLRKAFDEINERNEENVQKLMKEFTHLDEERKKRIAKYKDESEKSLLKYK